jgi:hypothetical protein
VQPVLNHLKHYIALHVSAEFGHPQEVSFLCLLSASSETSVEFQKTARQYIPNYTTVQLTAGYNGLTSYCSDRYKSSFSRRLLLQFLFLVLIFHHLISLFLYL